MPIPFATKSKTADASQPVLSENGKKVLEETISKLSTAEDREVFIADLNLVALGLQQKAGIEARQLLNDSREFAKLKTEDFKKFLATKKTEG